ncbi:MAG: YceI family protein [Xanthomonadaceae bacterium]|nr:YceI family protein [Xanthomonadaceae bacterium]
MLTGVLALIALPVLAEPVTYRIDPAHTDVLAQWNHFGFSNPSAHFGQANGTLVYDADNVAASSVEVTLPISGLESFVPDLNTHLLGPDFFSVVQFPTATFKSTRVESAGTDTLKVTGDLTVKGITRPVQLDVTLNGRGEHMMAKRDAIGFDATAVVKRSDFGMSEFIPAVSDEIRLRITTEALTPAPAAD